MQKIMMQKCFFRKKAFLSVSSRNKVDNKEAVISIASMLNKNGYGTLYFGIRDDGCVLGQEIGKETLRDISHAISENIIPQVIPTINVVDLEDKQIIKVEVLGKDVPYSAYGKYYIRSADEDRVLAPHQLRELMFKPIGDEIVMMPSYNQDLTFNKLKSLYKSRGLNINEKKFNQNLNLLTPD